MSNAQNEHRFELVASSHCDSVYLDTITGEKVVVWVVGGTGEIAVDFEHYGYTRRTGKYAKQTWYTDGLPTIDKLLSRGYGALANFVDLNYPRKQMREKRLARLPRRVESRRLHDPTEHYYYTLEVEFRAYLPRITINSAHRGGPADACEIARANYAWGNLNRLLFALESKYGNDGHIEDINQDEFDHLAEVVKGLK